jgi:hypothetical protein
MRLGCKEHVEEVAEVLQEAGSFQLNMNQHLKKDKIRWGGGILGVC